MRGRRRRSVRHGGGRVRVRPRRVVVAIVMVVVVDLAVPLQC